MQLKRIYGLIVFLYFCTFGLAGITPDAHATAKHHHYDALTIQAQQQQKDNGSYITTSLPPSGYGYISRSHDITDTPCRYRDSFFGYLARIYPPAHAGSISGNTLHSFRGSSVFQQDKIVLLIYPEHGFW